MTGMASPLSLPKRPAGAECLVQPRGTVKHLAAVGPGQVEMGEAAAPQIIGATNDQG